VLPLGLAKQRTTLHAQAAAGSGLMRQDFRWFEIEPSKGRWAWGYHDALIQAAAENGIRILPVITSVRPDQKAAPKPGVRITSSTTMPPKDPAEFARFAAAIVKRYGPAGSFWADHPDVPKLPLTSWQIWNEPNLKAYWGGRPNQNEYARLLVAAGSAIRAVDPEAEIVTGGLPQSKLGIPMADYIGLLSRAAPAGAFDTVAIHPYARSVDGVIASVVRARAKLDRAGRKDVALWVTEFGWATGGPGSPFTVGPRTQGTFIAEAFERLAALAPELRLRGIVYYAWRDVPPYPGGKDFWGLHTGLLSLDGQPKAGLASFTAAADAIRAGS
jgi:polysaccharide biosynthesis protein PslG